MSELGQLLEAVHFAAAKHKNQRRKNAESTPYINHPISVAHVLWKEGGVTDLATLQTAVLHDTVEDTDTTPEEIGRHFGSEVKDLVAEVTDDKSLSKLERKRLQIEHAAHTSGKAKLVKLADKLDNLRDLTQATPVGWSEQRVQEYFEWSAKVTKGLMGTNQAMEDAIEQVLNTRGVSFRE
ncbi:hypothetical protein EMCRGX_G030655 [Ephydatia muelleri]|eukprot:Em0010g898a